jgi:hypothetical protein
LKRHLLCLTLDTDPDGLNGRVPDRRSLEWEGLVQVQHLPEKLDHLAGKIGRVPLTWFVRADGQLESHFGSSAYLLENYSEFWAMVRKAGHEVGWHPHLYREGNVEGAVRIISDPIEARDELERLWNKLKAIFRPTAFRNGEGWHIPETFVTIERLGFACDSTAIPGRKGNSGHPLNWVGAPNQPYFPHADDLSKPGPARNTLEVPMNTWHLKAPYDDSARVRYMNPAVHPHLFAKAWENWEAALKGLPGDLCVWVMIFHPDEVLSTRGPDALYARSTDALCSNLSTISDGLQRLGHKFEWATVSHAAERWRNHPQSPAG